MWKLTSEFEARFVLSHQLWSCNGRTELPQELPQATCFRETFCQLPRAQREACFGNHPRNYSDFESSPDNRLRKPWLNWGPPLLGLGHAYNESPTVSSKTSKLENLSAQAGSSLGFSCSWLPEAGQRQADA